MKIITISREFGSGGREIGKRLADTLGFDYYDREIIAEIAKNKGMNERYVEGTLNGSSFVTPITLNFGVTFGYAPVTNVKTDLLVEEKRVLEGIAKRGRNCVIVGRNADVILRDYKPFSIFVCASLESRVKRSMMREEGGLTEREIERNVKRIDKDRAKTRAFITDSPWGVPTSYSITINTTGEDIEYLTNDLATFIKNKI